jgi:hypothetical protein
MPMNFKFLNVLKSPNSGILGLLNNNIIGTPGFGMLYQHMGVANKIMKIADPFFVALTKTSSVIGTCCFCKRVTLNSQQEIRSFYIRYFSFQHKYRRKHISESKVSGKSLLRDEVRVLLAGNGLEIKPIEKFFHYAYVDPRNIRSAALCKEFGFETVRQYTTIIFSRLRPQKHLQVVHEISYEQEPGLKKLLADFYRSFNMFSFENLFDGRKYYVVKDEQGNVMAGAQANPDQWKILALPGLSGKVILNLFTYLPVLKKLINKDYRFLTLEGIYYAPGQEQKLEVLFEDLLNRYNVNAAITVVDANTQLYTTLKSLKLGPVDKLNKEVRGNVICKFFNFDDDTKKQFNTNPAYISGIDVT